jgi:catechol-2,3-dioxygenase
MSDPKVIGLAGYGLEVPDLDVAEKFYGAFGLATTRSNDLLHLRSPGRPRDEAVISRGPAKRLHHLSFVIRPADEAPFADKLRKAGLDVVSAPPGGGREGLWFQDPWGTWINLSPGEFPQTPAPARVEGGVDVHLWQKLERNPKPARIGHMLVFTPEYEKAEAFFTAVLGLRTTDRAAGKVSFMAAGEGVIDHHCFGLIPSTHRGFQHASFQVASIDDIGFGIWNMRKAGYAESFGPGRHLLASNLFHYVRDPWGSWVEYYAEMDRISDRWETRDWKELPYVWGPEWSPEFWGKEMNGNFEPR